MKCENMNNENYKKEIIERTRPYINRYNEIEGLLAAPEIAVDVKLYQKLVREFERLIPLKEEAELIELAENEKETQEGLERIEKALLKIESSGEERVRLRLGKDMMVGQDAEVFLDKLKRGYSKLFEKFNWEYTEDEKGFLLYGEGVSLLLGDETGQHSFVDGIGEKGARVLLVAVLKDEKVKDIEFSEKDLRIDVFRASGAGGQHVNKTESAVRVTHLPSGISVVCQQERSQLQNKTNALENIKKKVAEFYVKEREKKMRDSEKEAKAIIKSGRGVRVYDFGNGKVKEMGARLRCEIVKGEIVFG